jgi:hypothetical protein
MPAALEGDPTEHPNPGRLTRELIHLFSELTSGILTRDEIRQTPEAASPPREITNP